MGPKYPISLAEDFVLEAYPDTPIACRHETGEARDHTATSKHIVVAIELTFD